jgi:tetratricopeptide (TPR) repeat protein
MNGSRLMSVVLTLSFSFSLAGQEAVPQAGSGGQPFGAAEFKREIERRIAGMEDAVRRSVASHVSDFEVGKLEGQLGLLYEDAALWERSEAALAHAVLLLRRDPAWKAELAKALSEEGNLHVVMEKFRESEKEVQEALRLREEMGDKLEIARSWDDLAGLSLARHKYAQARDFGQQAVAEFAADERAEPYDRILPRYTLALAACHLRDYATAILLLTAATDEAKAQLQPQDLPVGFGEFLLGYALWKSGDTSAASGHLEAGIAGLRETLGWGHPVYLKVLGYYSKFLRETRRMEEANSVEREIRRAEGVVDVRALVAGTGRSGLDGLR